MHFQEQNLSENLTKLVQMISSQIKPIQFLSLIQSQFDTFMKV